MNQKDSVSLSVVYAITSVLKIASGLSAFFMAIYLKSIGFTGIQIGIVFAAASLTGLVFVFWAGMASDRFPIKAIISAGIVMYLAYYSGLMYAASFSAVLVLFLMGGLGGNIAHTAMDSYALKKAETSKGRKMGVYGALKSVSFGVGVVAGGYLLFMLRFSIVMAVSAAAVLAMLLIVPLIRNTSTAKISIISYIADFKSRRVVMFSVLLLIFTLHWGVENVAYSLFLKENLHLGYVQMGWFMAIPIVFLGISSVYMGRKFDRGFSAKGLLLMSFLVSGLGLLLMALSKDVYSALFFRIVHEIGDGAFMVFVYMGAASYFTRERMGGNYGLITLITIVGTVLGSLIFSPIGASYGYEWPNIICGAMIAAAGIFILLFRDEVHV